MTQEEIIKSIKKVSSKRNRKKGGGVLQPFWRLMRKQKFVSIGTPLTEKQCGAIIKLCNKSLAEKLFSHMSIRFPYGLGGLELRQSNKEISLNDKGEVISGRAIDWDRTLKLWAEDEGAKQKKMLVKVENKELFKIKYNKQHVYFTNRAYLTFKANRGLKQSLVEKIRNKEIDAYLYAIH